jgi:hypothetical protein
VEVWELRVASNAEVAFDPFRIGAAQKEVIVTEEGACTLECIAVVQVGNKVCLLSEEDMGGRFLDDFSKIVEAIGA